MTARHMRDALICGAYRGDHRVGAVAATTADEYEPAVLAPVAIGFTEAELFALADHYRRTGLAGRVSILHPDLGAAVGAILAAADDIESKEGDR